MNSTTLPIYLNPALRPGLDALDWWLADAHYSQHARERIVSFAAAEGTLTGSPYLEAEDEADATDTFIGALPAVAGDNPAWDDQTVILDARLLADGNHPWPIPIVSDDDDRTIPPELDPEEEETGEFGPPPGIDPEPYEPTEEDMAELRRWELETEGRRLGLELAPIRGGAPAGPSDEDVAEAMAHCRMMDALAELRAAEARAEAMWGYE